MRRLLVVCVVSLACSPISPFRADAGVDAGAIAGGFAGGTVSGGGSAGGSSGGGSAGGNTAGGSPTRRFSWTTIGVPNGAAVLSVAARGSDLYAVTSANEVLHTSGTSLARVQSVTLPDAADIYVSPSGKVWVSSSRNASLVCDSNCSTNGAWVTKYNSLATEWFIGLCGEGEQVFAVAVGTSLEGILMQYTNGAWRRVTTSLGVGDVRNCVVAPNGDVWVSGVDGVSRVVNGGATPQSIDLGMQGAARWQWVALSFDGGTVTDGLLVGAQGGYRLARRDGAGLWTATVPNVNGVELYGVVTLDDHEFLAAGRPSPGGAVLLRYGENVLSALQAQPPLILSVDAMWVSSPNEVFVVGRTNSGQRILSRGTR